MPTSVQCPRCNGTVSVAEQAAGKRVACPHCAQQFLAPGVIAAANDDDDWLQLDEPQTATPPPPGRGESEDFGLPNQPPPPQPTRRQDPIVLDEPILSGDAEAIEAIDEIEEIGAVPIVEEIDDFTSETETPPAPIAPGQPIGGAESPTRSDDLFADLPPLRDAPPQPPPPRAAPKRTLGTIPLDLEDNGTESATSPAPATPVEYATEYRVKCNVCGTTMYAKAHQEGKTIKCSDCYSSLTVPPPPKLKKKPELNLEQSPIFKLGKSDQRVERNDPFQKSAEQLLADAARDEKNESLPNRDNDIPNVVEWFKNVFGIFKDLGVVAHVLGLSMLAAVPTVIALSAGAPYLMIGLMPLGLFWSALVVCCGFAILQSVANEEPKVDHWPVFDPTSWLDQLFVAVAAAGVCGVPVWAVCHFLGPGGMLGIAATMFSIFALFPFVLLSMLDMGTPLAPFSPEVARSVNKCEEAWGGFYFSSGTLFAALFLFFLLLSGSESVSSAVVGIVGGVAGTFIYFAMIGRLAYAIGQAVNAPPRDSDVESERARDGETMESD